MRELVGQRLLTCIHAINVPNTATGGSQFVKELGLDVRA